MVNSILIEINVLIHSALSPMPSVAKRAFWYHHNAIHSFLKHHLILLTGSEESSGFCYIKSSMYYDSLTLETNLDAKFKH